MSNILDQLQSYLEYQIQLEGPELIVAKADFESEPEAESILQQVSEESKESSIREKPSIEDEASNVTSTTQEASSIKVKENTSQYDTFNSLIPTDSPIYKMDNLDDLVDYIKKTELIELDKTRINAVPGIGDPNADLMVIGEAPGANEDKQGEPFVGLAGTLLTKILKAINFDREDVYITNILKSRPTDNRDPLPAEIAEHIPFLWKQIALIQPKLILCAGKVAGTTLLNRQTSLKELRKDGFHDLHGIPVMVTYHPSALRRNPEWKRACWEDVQALRKKYDELGGKQK